MALRKRWCQDCSTPTQLDESEQPKACRFCGGVNYGRQPPMHSRHGWRLSVADRIFMKVNRIKAEE